MMVKLSTVIVTVEPRVVEMVGGKDSYKISDTRIAGSILFKLVKSALRSSKVNQPTKGWRFFNRRP